VTVSAPVPAAVPASVPASPPTTPELEFSVAEVVPAPFTVVPTLDVRLRVGCRVGGAIQCILLHAMVSIAAARRSYDAATQARLVELFAEPARWDTTLRSLVWAQPMVVVPAFVDATDVTVPLPCSYDFEIATTKYLHAVRDGDVMLELLLRGTVFYGDAEGRLRTGQIPWQHEATSTFPVTMWHELMDRYYGTTRWVKLGQDTFDRLAAYKARHTMTSWDHVLDGLLPPVEEGRSAWTR
jgi:hypothetical protein